MLRALWKRYCYNCSYFSCSSISWWKLSCLSKRSSRGRWKNVLEDAQETLEKSGGAINIATGTQAGGAGDLSGEAAIFDESLPEESGGMLDIYGNMNYPTKRNFDSPEAIKVSKEIGLLPKDEGNGKNGNGNGKFDDGWGWWHI